MIKPILQSQELVKAINQSDLIKSYCNIPKEWKDITKVSKNSVHRKIGDGKFNARFYGKRKLEDKVTTNIVLTMEKEGVFKHLEKRFGEKILESYYLQSEFKPKLVKYASANFIPNANPETVSVDGYIDNAVASETWAQITAGNGTTVDDSDSIIQLRIIATTTTDEYEYLSKIKMLFDTSSIGDGYYVDSATLSMTPLFTELDDFGMSLALVSATTASNTSLSTSDFNSTSFGSTRLASDKTVASMTNDVEFSMSLNTAGISNIDMNGVSKFGAVPDFVLDGGPTWGNSYDTRLILYSADNGSLEPNLDVTYFEITGYANLLLMGAG